jgi:hypothetical protein
MSRSIFGPESESDSEEVVDVPQITYANYSVGDFISFKKSENANEPISYGVISKILDDTSQYKSYDIIYYDTGRDDASVTSNPVVKSVLREIIPIILPTTPNTPVTTIQKLLRHDQEYRSIVEVTKITVPEIPEAIREPLQAALNTTDSLNTPSASRSTTGTSYGDISRDSSSISRSSSSGGKRYRKMKNKTKRRNKKTKRRRNRKTKRR